MFDPIGDGGAIVSRDIILNDGLDTSVLNHIPPAGIVESHPHFTLWSMNYLFVSHNRKRIVLFACVQTMHTPRGNENDNSEAEYGKYAKNDIVFDDARHEEENSHVHTSSGTDNKSGKSTPIGDESVMSVMVDDTDFEEGSVDDDGEVDPGEYDFDTGAMEISIGVPSQIV